jgi:hypothetical protein
VERAKRLRDHIERLRQGQPEPPDPKKSKSLKEQVEEKTAGTKK